MNMPLWYNLHISRLPLFNKNLYEGCIHIADIFKSDGKILSGNEIYDLYYQHCNFLEYHRLKTGLSNYMVQFFQAYIKANATHSFRIAKRKFERDEDILWGAEAIEVPSFPKGSGVGGAKLSNACALLFTLHMMAPHFAV